MHLVVEQKGLGGVVASSRSKEMYPILSKIQSTVVEVELLRPCNGIDRRMPRVANHYLIPFLYRLQFPLRHTFTLHFFVVLLHYLIIFSMHSILSSVSNLLPIS